MSLLLKKWRNKWYGWLSSRCERTITPQQRSCLLLPGQHLVSEIKSCDFVVRTAKDFFVEKIMFDQIFCNDMVDRCKLFFKKAVLPELVGKLYSRPLQEHAAKQNHQISSCSNVQDQLVICICWAVYKEDVDNVIGCDNENCPYVWLH